MLKEVKGNLVPEIQFGTDGWRAVIGDAFTISRMKKAAQAVCTVLREHEIGRQSHGRQAIVVGHDWRYMSERFAMAAAHVISSNGFKVKFLSHAATSPMLAFTVSALKARLGVMITASHNPPHFNGLKLKDSFGGPMEDSFVREVEGAVGRDVLPPGSGTPQEIEALKQYHHHLTRQVNMKLFNRQKWKIAVDCMHGPSAAVLDRLFGKTSGITTLRRNRDPLFGGVNPEPIEKNLSLLKGTIIRGHYSAGLAFDGDADRLGVVDEAGRYLPPHVVFPLLLLHAIENRKWKGKVVQTVSMGYLPERIARHFGLYFQEVPVGFKYVSQIMIHEPVIAGGEESGGYGFGAGGAERDGILSGLLLLEYMATRRKTLSQLVEQLESRFGKSRFLRRDFHTDRPVVDRTSWTETISKKLSHAKMKKKIKNVKTLDGIKITLEDDSWILMRPSGTESLIRLYSEAPETKVAERLLDWGEELCGFKTSSKIIRTSKK